MKRLGVLFPCTFGLTCASVRQLSGLGADSILGTSMLSGGLLKTIQEDLHREQNIRKHGIGETLTNFIRKDELSHMESPESDKIFNAKLETRVDDFFANLAAPQDPMAAALARSPEDLEDEAAAEVVREAVREAYMRKLSAKQAEELRLKRAMGKAEMGREAYTTFREEVEWNERAATASAVASRGVTKPAQSPKSSDDDMADENEALRRELEAMKKRMAMLEKELGDKH